MAKVTPCQFLGLVSQKLSVSTSCFLGFSLLEPSHHAVGKPEQPMEGNKAWLSVLAELPASSQFSFANHVSESPRSLSSYPQMSCPGRHLVEQNLTFLTMPCPDCRFMS